jgi:hypothetical protein
MCQLNYINTLIDDLPLRVEDVSDVFNSHQDRVSSQCEQFEFHLIGETAIFQDLTKTSCQKSGDRLF